MALLTPQTIDRDGTQIAFAAAAGGGDTVAYAPARKLLVNNGDASPVTVTVSVNATIAGVTVPDLDVVCAAGEITGILLDARQADANGIIAISYSAVTSITVAAVS